MCLVDSLIERVNQTHAEKDKRELEEALLVYREKARLERENVRLYIKDIKREFQTLRFP